MEILISMKGESEGGYTYKNPYMNNASSYNSRYFIAEIREIDENKVKLLQSYSLILLKKLNDKNKYKIEQTRYGFKLKKKVDNNRKYTEQWDEWSQFSTVLHQELESFFEE